MCRILMIPTPFRFFNPTWDLLVESLSRYNTVEIFGPRSGRECSSLKRVFHNYGKFDAVICDPWFFFKDSNAPAQFKPQDLDEVDVPVILSLMQYDLHNLSKQVIEEISERATIAISAVNGNGFFYTPSKEDFENEAWLQPGSYSISSENVLGQKFVVLPHCIGPSEFVDYPLSKKRSDVIVPGVEYHFRKTVKNFLEGRRDFSMSTERDLMQRVIGRLISTNIFGNSLMLSRAPSLAGPYHRRFQRAIGRAHVAVTCEGSIGYPIRKFFEIPAAGTVLAGKFFRDPQRLGFRDRINCYSLSEDKLEDLLEIITLARSDSLEARMVREAGYALVYDRHRVEVRVRQLLDLCECLSLGSANTIIWQDGAPIYKQTEASF